MAHKGFCEDITEGKFSFPIIHAVRSQPANHQLLSTHGRARAAVAARARAAQRSRDCVVPARQRRPTDILKQKTDNVEVVTYAVKTIREAGSLEYTVTFLETIEARARSDIDRLGSNPAITRILDVLAEVYRPRT